MERTRRKSVVVMLMFMVSAFAYSGTIYHEIFTYAGAASTAKAGWHWFNWDGTTWRNETSSTQTQVSSAAGAAIGVGSINSNPAVADATSGYLYCSQAYGTGKNLLLWTDEYAIDRSLYSDITLSFSNNNTVATEQFGAVVALASTQLAPGWTWDQVDWYVTDLQTISLKGWTETPTSYDLDASNWSHLSVSATTHVLAVGDSVGSLPAGYIVGFGLFGQDRASLVKIDNVKIDAIPEPMTLSLLGCAAVGGLLLRRRQQ